MNCTPEEETEMSINAKFRAIQPSSSILSYVEDNVCMICLSSTFYPLIACVTFSYCCLQLLGRRRLNEIKNAGYNVKISAPLDNVPFSTMERERIEESVRNMLYNQCHKCTFYFCLESLYRHIWYHIQFIMLSRSLLCGLHATVSNCCSHKTINRRSEISWNSLPLQRSLHHSPLQCSQR